MKVDLKAERTSKGILLPPNEPKNSRDLTPSNNVGLTTP
jgi:hypothetical protein